MDTRPLASLTIYRSGGRIRAQRWRWRLIDTRNGRIIAASSEGYYDRSEACRMAMMVVGCGYRVRPPRPLIVKSE